MVALLSTMYLIADKCVRPTNRMKERSVQFATIEGVLPDE